MFSVALIGPDGSGKSTISERLQADPSIRTKRIYMGINRSESNYALPTTRLVTLVRRLLKKENDQGGPRDISNETKKKIKNPLKRALKEVKSGLVLANNIAEEWYRQFVTWYFIRQDYIVVFDRHFYADYYYYHIGGAEVRWTSRLHGYMLQNLYPKPDLVIYLDAPAEVLFARKGEGTVELLEERRQAYLDMRDKVPCFEIVDSNEPVDDVYARVQNLIMNFKK